MAAAGALSLAAPARSLPGPDPAAALPDRSGYPLWNPAPAPLLRELSPDRPDKTESPRTVDAGHFQVEMDLVSYTYDRDRRGGADVRTETWSVAPVNLKAGLLDRLDVQAILETYRRVRSVDAVAGSAARQSGFGDVTVRLKYNFWGNDGGSTALGLMPFLKAPAAQDGLGNGAFEGGLILPFAWDLPGGWRLGAMTQAGAMHDERGPGLHAAFVNTVTLGRDLTKRLAAYVEFFSETGTERGADWIGTVDLGVTFSLSPNLQLDAGVNLGVTRSADDVNPFAGLTARF